MISSEKLVINRVVIEFPIFGWNRASRAWHFLSAPGEGIISRTTSRFSLSHVGPVKKSGIAFGSHNASGA